MSSNESGIEAGVSVYAWKCQGSIEKGEKTKVKHTRKKEETSTFFPSTYWFPYFYCVLGIIPIICSDHPTKWNEEHIYKCMNDYFITIYIWSNFEQW